MAPLAGRSSGIPDIRIRTVGSCKRLTGSGALDWSVDVRSSLAGIRGFRVRRNSQEVLIPYGGRGGESPQVAGRQGQKNGVPNRPGFRLPLLDRNSVLTWTQSGVFMTTQESTRHGPSPQSSLRDSRRSAEEIDRVGTGGGGGNQDTRRWLVLRSIRQGTEYLQGAGNGGLGHHRVLFLNGLNQPAEYFVLCLKVTIRQGNQLLPVFRHAPQGR